MLLNKKLSIIFISSLFILDIKPTGANVMKGCPEIHLNKPLESFQVLDGPLGEGQPQAPEGNRWVINPVPPSLWKPFYLACKYRGLADVVAVELPRRTRVCEIQKAPNVRCR